MDMIAEMCKVCAPTNVEQEHKLSLSEADIDAIADKVLRQIIERDKPHDKEDAEDFLDGNEEAVEKESEE